MGKPAWGGGFGGCTPSPGKGAPPKTTITSKAMGGGGSGVNTVPGPQYHNPDPLVRLIGTPNESRVEIEGVPITALIDSGANLSAITKSFAEELQLDIKGLQTILDIEPTGGGRVPYHGYVECKLSIPQIKKFNLDVLMLVIDDSPYAMRVPVQIGTLHIDMALDLATGEERKKLNRQWRRAELASSLRMKSVNANVEDSSKSKIVFDLNNITGSVQITKDLSLQPFENVTVSGLLKGPVKRSAYFKQVNVALEPMEQHKEGEGPYCAVPAYAFLKPGSKRVEVMLKNITAQPITIKTGEKVARIEPANAVPHMLAPQSLESVDPVVSKSAGTQGSGLKPRPRGGHTESDLTKAVVDRTPLSAEQIQMLLTKIDFDDGTKEWTQQQKERAKALLTKYSFLFAMDSMDLGKTDLVKHHIELTNYTPIKDRYRRIPPQQYEEVRKHLKEMLDIGAIRCSNSPWASPVVLVRKKDGSLRFCIDLRKLNAWTIKDAYSIPRIEDALDSLNGACIFTSLDLKSGY